MANLFELVGEITVQGVQTAQSKIQQVSDRAEGLGGRLNAAGEKMQAFGSSVSSVGDKMTGFSTAVAGATTAVGAAIKQYTDWANSTLNAAKQLGVGVEKLQVWQRTAKRAGVETGAFRDGIKELQMRVDEFVATGKGPAAEVLQKRLGISKDKLKETKGDAFALFELVRGEISKVNNAAERQRIMDELFGGQAAEQFGRLMQMSREEIQKTKDAVIEAGGILNEQQLKDARAFSNEMETLKQQMLAVGKAVAGALIPELREALPAIKSQLVPALKSAGEAVIGVIKAFTSLPGPVQGAILKIVALTAVVGPFLSIGGRLVGLIGKLFTGLSKIPGAATAAAGALRKMRGAAGVAATATGRMATKTGRAARGLKSLAVAAGSGVLGVFGKMARFIGRSVGSVGRLIGRAGLGGLAKMLGRLIPLVSAFFAGWEIGKIINSILAQFPTAQRAVRDFVGLIAVELPKKIGQMIGKIPGLLSRLPTLVQKMFRQAWNFAKQLTQQAFQKIRQIIKTGMQKAKQFIQQPLMVIKRLWQQTWRLVTQKFRQAWAGIRSILNSIKQAFTTAWNKITGVVRSAWNGIKSILNSIKNGFASAFETIRAQTIGRVESMVNAVTSKVKAMWQALTGNSIIPRMADEAVAEFGKMADQAEKQGERTRRGLEGSIAKADTGARAGAGGPGAGLLPEQGGGTGGDVNIDMSRATFRDDRDMLDRIKRKGSDLTGAFN